MNSEIRKYSHLINCKGKPYDLSTPKIMGIINCTPDSFYEKSRYSDLDTIEKTVGKMIEDGADIIDIGGVSTRPGAQFPTISEEKKRILPVIEFVQNKFPEILISVDTMYGEVAQEAVDVGICIVNDVSGGELDESIMAVAGKNKVPYVLTHSPGFIKSIIPFDSENYLVDVLSYLSKKIALCKSYGIKDIIIDPGFGFSKSLEQNFELIKKFQLLHIFECPILIGISRKSLIYKTLSISPEESLNGSTVLNTLLCSYGAQIIRVHDVREMAQIRSIIALCS
ncbi:MAG: dihydropteroate synthase [Bacteroidetes bacterium]|nr:dihydropteroate synthase [Bacteroidota bacterium]